MEHTNQPKHWRTALESIASMGSKDVGVRRLADLHEARKRHLGQFFTPISVVRLMWSIAMEAFDSLGAARKVRLLDNSVGTARMFHFATPERFELYGLDVHQESIEETQSAAEAAGFLGTFARAGMQDVILKVFDVALINPPFSLQLESPHLTKLACTRSGRFGPNTAATSDEYALAQALDAASVVIAVLPLSMVEQISAEGAGLLGEDVQRLRAVYRLPGNTFRGEGAQVATAIVVFSKDASGSVSRGVIDDPQAWKPERLGLRLEADPPKSIFKVRGISDDAPVITQPVTGDATVRVVHSGRKIHLKTRCGFVQAKVFNAVLQSQVFSMEGLRLAKGVRFAGQGLLDVECLLASDDPRAALDRLESIVRDAGGVPVVDVGLLRHLRRRMSRDKRAAAPLGHWVKAADLGDQVRAVARATVVFDAKSWTAPVIRKGEEVTLQRCGSGWTASKGKMSRELTGDEALQLFDMPAADAEWVQVHPPLQTQFPAVARSLEAEARKLGIHEWLTWDFQFADLIEVSMKPAGCVVGWKQGLGKARLAAALILIRRVRHGLVTMPAYLLDEFGKRLEAAGLDASLWQIIRSPEQLQNLRRINVISYERLRMPVRRGSRRSYGASLRRRIGLMVSDEGEVLANTNSDQSRAMKAVAPPVWYVLTGTPMPNYPRDLLPISMAAVGDGVVGQPYGWHQPMLVPNNVDSMSTAVRGIDAFRESFVALEWVTHEFTEDMTTGAKREVPKVNNLDSYREWISRFVKRRLTIEPEVERFVRIPTPSVVVHDVAWDEQHLGYYLRTADEFMGWYRDAVKGHQKVSNLMLLLARIGAVERACNIPQMKPPKGELWRGGLTSKQHAVLDRVQQLVGEGDKIVVFAKNPEQLELLAKHLTSRGIPSVLFHGGIETSKRNRVLDRDFRYGPVQVLLATVGVMQAGWDLYQARRALFVDRSWSAKIEDQAARRLLRPQQTSAVVLEFFHLHGSIDEYQAQMVAWKSNAADAGLDWAAPMGEEVSFLHLDHIIEKFVSDLASRRGMKAYELRTVLKDAA
jgi:hypothetical protein